MCAMTVLLCRLGALGVVAVVPFVACTGAIAAPLYLGVSVGGAISPDVTVVSRSNDRASICDEYINPGALAVPGCSNPNRGAGDGWRAPFDRAAGFSAEAELGYRLSSGYRFAGLFSYSRTDFDQTVSSTDASGADFDKISNELAVGEETLGAVRSREFFLLGLRDWPNRSRWTPYLGAGVGVSWMRKDFSWLWARSADPQDIATGSGQPNAEEIQNNLAGTVSTGRAVLRDVVAGYVLMAGVDRAVSDTLSVGFRIQWKHRGAFDSDAYQGDVLRSHAPNLRLDGSEPVSAWSGTGDTARWSALITLRYAAP